jgi:hypothetical protein
VEVDIDLGHLKSGPFEAVGSPPRHLDLVGIGLVGKNLGPDRNGGGRLGGAKPPAQHEGHDEGDPESQTRDRAHACTVGPGPCGIGARD